VADHIYEAGVTKTTGAAAGTICTIVPAAITTATTRNPEVREIGIFVGTSPPATGPEVCIMVPAAAGVTPTASTVQALNHTDPAGHTTLVPTWTTYPTVNAGPNYIRRAWLPNTTGAGIIWVWQPGEFMLWQGVATTAGQINIWQLSALATVYDVYVKMAE
jgi:hypothetical protein